MAAVILQIAYYASLMETRKIMLETAGYEVASALGNDQGIALALMREFDVVLVGFSATQSVRGQMIRWLKQHCPQTPVVALLAHTAERFPDADHETLSEDPQSWLAAIAERIKPS